MERKRNPGSTPPLAEACIANRGSAGPVKRQQSLPHIAVKGGIRPVDHARNQTMLERIDMNVVDMAGEVAVVADGVLPEPSLPQAVFADMIVWKRRPRCGHA